MIMFRRVVGKFEKRGRYSYTCSNYTVFLVTLNLLNIVKNLL